MVKLNLGSWLGSPGTKSDINTNSDMNRKKQNRRSFAGLGSLQYVRASSPTYSPKENNSHVAKNEGENNHHNHHHPRSMTALAETISRETTKLESYLRDKGLPMPSFEVDAADDFPQLPEDMQRSRLEIIHATKQLRELTIGPRETMRWGIWEVSSTWIFFFFVCLLLNILVRAISFSTYLPSRSSTTTI